MNINDISSSSSNISLHTNSRLTKIKNKTLKFLKIDQKTLGFQDIKKTYYANICWIAGKYSIVTLPYVIHKLSARMEIFIIIFILYTFILVPLTFMVAGLSQYSTRSFITLWDMSPAWRGIGYIGITCLIIHIFHSTIYSTYFFHYLIQSFADDLPWLRCEQQTFTDTVCYTFAEKRSIMQDCAAVFNETHCHNLKWENSALVYFQKFTESTGPNYEGYNSKIVGYQFFVVILIYICIRKNLTSLGTVSPILVYVPFVLHSVLLLRTLFHFESFESFAVVFNFKASLLFNERTWFVIIVSTLGSLHVVYGGISTFASQNNFRSPVNLHTIMVTIVCGTFNILYIFFLFNVIGNLSYELNMSYDELFDLSYEFNFVQCPLLFYYWKEASNMWNFIFFAANFLTIIRNVAAECNVLFHIFYEKNPNFIPYCLAFAMLFSFAYFLICVLNNFYYILKLIDLVEKFLEAMIVPLLTFYFITCITLFYGVSKFVDDMHFMLGFRPHNLWILHYYIAPIIYFISFVFSCLTWKMFNMNASFLVIISTLFIILAIFPFIYFIIYIVPKAQIKNIRSVLQPKASWGPKNDLLKKSRDMFSSHDMTKEYLYRQQRLKTKTTSIKTASRRVTFTFD